MEDNRIEILEKRVQNLTLEINTLKDQMQSIQNELYSSNKTFSFESSLNISDQLNTVKNSYGTEENKQEPLQSEKSGINSVNNAKGVKETILPDEAIFSDKVSSDKYLENDKPSYNTISNKKQPRDIENILGKRLMGIFASVLIFIAIILGASLIVPNLPDAAKITLMFVISFAFLIGGLFLMKKDPENKFYVALAGCGYGAVYLSLFVTKVIFGYLNPYVLYGLIFVWVISIYISKINNAVFRSIAQAGIFLSLLLGLINDDKFLLFLVMIYIITTQSLLLVYEHIAYKNIKATELVGGLLCLIIYWPGISLLDEMLVPFFLIIATLYCILYIGYSIKFSELGAKQLSYARFFMPICFFEFLIILDSSSLALEGCYLGGIYDNKDLIHTIFTVITYISTCAFLSTMLITEKKKEINLFVPQLLSCLLYIWLIINENVFTLWQYLYMVLPLIGAYVCYHKFKTRSLKVLITSHLVLIYLIGSFIFDLFYHISSLTQNDYDYRAFTGYAYFFMMIICGAVNYIFKIRHKDTKEVRIASYIVNIVLMYLGYTNMIVESMHRLYLIGNNEGLLSIFKVLYVVVLTALFTINSKNLLDRHKTGWDFYVGVKYLLLLIGALYIFDAEAVVVSIFLLVMAIACIIIGFAFKYKGFRLFGLCLAMICVFKLVFVDISAATTIGRVISFFISGMLCFVINMIYNAVGQKLNTDKSDLKS
ncbi:MAG: DUF2339 domain-containing protein [Butyrivibrio sp.]|uniref:DUF2339 domain-containing protein n=1 Tax=Butyrivibrio sp. TaxID=28121 RepID=UPI0025E2694F|nr:DUF2339 domain-containing protein [Butyrivibrio sp.]MCR5770954.1 DUF2339 domain-containing protein [Butyrivibrio sp.]